MSWSTYPLKGLEKQNAKRTLTLLQRSQTHNNAAYLIEPHYIASVHFILEDHLNIYKPCCQHGVTRCASDAYLESAIPLVRKIAPIAKRHGFSVALYGSVLDVGRSEKDLDLFFVEQDSDICDVQGCLDEIRTLPEIRSAGKAFQCGGGACAVIWTRNRTVIDAQFRSVGSVYASCAPI